MRYGISVTFISGIVPPHWKLSMIADSILPPATAAWCWFGLNSCAAPKVCTSTLPPESALTSAANCSRFFAEWCAGGNWWLRRIVTSAACAPNATPAATAAAQILCMCFMTSPPKLSPAGRHRHDGRIRGRDCNGSGAGGRPSRRRYAAFFAQRSSASQPPMCVPLMNTWGTVPCPVMAPTARLRTRCSSGISAYS